MGISSLPSIRASANSFGSRTSMRCSFSPASNRLFTSAGAISKSIDSSVSETWHRLQPVNGSVWRELQLARRLQPALFQQPLQPVSKLLQLRNQPAEPLLVINLQQPLLFRRRRDQGAQFRIVQRGAARNPIRSIRVLGARNKSGHAVD